MSLKGVTLHSYWRSSCSWRVRIGLHLKAIPYTYRAVNLLKSEQVEAPFAERNPLRQVPCLEWVSDEGPRRLTQSLAILRFLSGQPGRALVPDDPWLAARVWQLAEIVNAGIQPLQNLKVLKSIVELGGDRKGWGQDVIRSGFEAMEAIAAETSTAGRFLVGDSPSLADACLVPQMYNARRFELPLEAFPTLVSVDAHCAGLPAFSAAHPNEQPDAVEA